MNIANAAIKPAAGLRTDNSTIRIRQFDKAKLAEYEAKKDFKYDGSTGYTRSPWQQFWRKFWGLLNQNLSGTSGSIIKYLFIALACAAVIFAVIKFSGMNAEPIFDKKSASAEIRYSESTENIHEISFAEEIDQAVSAKNYRLGIRLLYLSCLKRLNDSGHINWELNKTNSAYIKELKNSQQRERFVVLTRQFEYVWYGNFPIDATKFSAIHKTFNDFSQGIHP